VTDSEYAETESAISMGWNAAMEEAASAALRWKSLLVMRKIGTVRKAPIPRETILLAVSAAVPVRKETIPESMG
jgi:hypothetical protein